MKNFLSLIASIIMSFQSIVALAQEATTIIKVIETKIETTKTEIENKFESKEILVQAPEKKSLVLDATTKRQGEFFQVLIKGLNEKPKLWFNANEYPLFEIPEDIEASTHSSKKQNILYRALVPVENMTKPGNYSVLARADGWEERIQVIIKDNEKPISKITLSDSKSTIYATQKELDIVGTSLKTLSDKKLWLGNFTYPSTAPKSSPFGVKRSYNGGPADSYHKGLDFAANMGAPVYAPADAKVIAVGKEAEGFNVHGNTIILDHGHGVTSIYMHLSKIDVRQAQELKTGEKIGEVGHTGISTGPHLHWGLYLSGTSIDPELFVKNSIL